MAVLDRPRASLRLDGRELAAALLLATDPTSPSLRHPGLGPALRSLEAAGAVAGAALDPVVARLLAVVHRPQLRLVVEVERAGAVVASAAWATPDMAVVGRSTGDDAVDYSVTDPLSLPFVLAAVVGLGPGAAGRGPGPLTVALDDLAAAEDLVSEGNGSGAVALLERSGLPRPGAEVVVEVVVHRISAWRATSRWMDAAGGMHDRELVVLDAGRRGLWRSTAGAGAVTLSPVAPAQVWAGLVGLFPKRP